jgi:hypothetical protein
MALDVAKEAMSDLRAKYANEKKNGDRKENPELNQARPENPFNICRFVATLPVFFAQTFRGFTHRRCYFSKREYVVRWKQASEAFRGCQD